MSTSNKAYWVYILICENGSYYTGYTTDLAKRYQSHLDGTGGCKYTRSFKPVGIAQCWQITGSKSIAMQLEAKIKRLSRAGKERLIADPASAFPDSRVKVYSAGMLFDVEGVDVLMLERSRFYLS